jgi:uncharacterized protein YggU (UPF0235/DUF167 family)
MKTMRVKVKPNARVSALEDAGNGQWLAQLKVTLVAQHFGCRKLAVSIKSGTSARLKLVQIDVD